MTEPSDCHFELRDDMATTGERRLTLREFLALPDTKPASEYIDGRVVQKPMPGVRHSIIQGQLAGHLDQAMYPRMLALLELRCPFAGRCLVPDVVVVLSQRVPRDASGDISDDDICEPPDMAVEVVSPEQQVGEMFGWLKLPKAKS